MQLPEHRLNPLLQKRSPGPALYKMCAPFQAWEGLLSLQRPPAHAVTSQSGHSTLTSPAKGCAAAATLLWLKLDNSNFNLWCHTSLVNGGCHWRGLLEINNFWCSLQTFDHILADLTLPRSPVPSLYGPACKERSWKEQAAAPISPHESQFSIHS